jgi:hypothetical protein
MQHKRHQYILSGIRNKLQQNNLTTARADKSKAMVIINKNTLQEKIDQFITSNHIPQLIGDPTKQFQTDVKEAIKTCNLIIPPNHQKFLTQMKPAAPELNAYIKTHKPNHPIRPVINNIKAPAYKTARYLNKTINNHITLPNTYSIRNTADIAAELILLQLNKQHRLMTLDIKDLYVNITLPSIMNSTDYWFRTQNQPKTIINQTLQLIQTVLQQNYFHTNGQYYRPNKGIAMGSPLSSTAAEIVLQHIEHLLIKHWLETQEILYYKRYVDDILIIYDSAKLDPTQVTDFFNHYNPDLHFTSTHENDNCINYLDLTITRATQSLQLGIYRKPTNTDTTISYNSTHPIQHKLAAYRYYISRMVTLPITHTEKEKEWNIIQSLAMSNSIPPDTLYKLRRQIQQKSHKTNIQTTNPKARVTFTFSSPIIYKITNLFRKTDLQIAYRPTNTINKILKPPIQVNPLTQSGIYKISCASCDRAYVGQSGRAIRTRYNEHIPYIRNNNPESAFSQHILNTSHNIGPSSQTLQLLKSCPKGKLMNSWEKFYIQQFKQQSKLVSEQYQPDPNPLYTLSYHPT